MDYIDEVCKLGQGEHCCRYLVAGSQGLECSKIELRDKAIIDQEWAKNGHNHTAQGDNCEGQDLLIKKQLGL